MATHYDEKGKWFTEKVTKDEVAVILQTIMGRIEGNLFVMAGTRLTDEINNTEQFIAVTNAKIFNLKGECDYFTHFVNVNREHIIWLIPQSEIKEVSDCKPGED